MRTHLSKKVFQRSTSSLTLEAGTRKRGDLGVRVVKTDQRNEGFAAVDGTDPADAPLIEDGQSYTDYLTQPECTL